MSDRYERIDYTTELFRLASRLFLFLVSFRRKVRKGFRVEEAEVRSALAEIFEEQEREARRDPRLDALYEKAKYPLVILADEVLLHSDWEFASAWEKDLLEEKLYGTNIGGDKIFSLAEELRPDDVEMATILFTALSLGVRGRYRESPEKFEEKKSKIYRQLSEYLADVSGRITPDAYHVSEKKAKRFSLSVTVGRIVIVAAGLVFLYVVSTQIAWSQLAGDIKSIVESLT